MHLLFCAFVVMLMLRSSCCQQQLLDVLSRSPRPSMSSSTLQLRIDSFSTAAQSAASSLLHVCVSHPQQNSQSRCQLGQSSVANFQSQKLPFILEIPLPIISMFSFNLEVTVKPQAVVGSAEDGSNNQQSDNDLTLIRLHRRRNNMLPSSDWSVESATSNDGAQIQLSYRVRCNSDMYGPACAVNCVARDNRFGHYKCDPVTGERICLPGWTGSDCLSAICPVNCNKIGGVCRTPGQCTCREGWTGEHCDFCRTKPSCKHGTCEMPGQCICKDGWTGENCDTPVNVCATKGKRCIENGGKCSNLNDGTYRCECPFRRHGKDCDMLTSYCSSSPCQNGGTCLDVDVSPGYKCICSTTTTGTNCEQLLPVASNGIIGNVERKVVTSAVKQLDDSSSTTANSSEQSLTTTHLALIIAFGVIGPCASILLISVIVVLRRRQLSQAQPQYVVQTGTTTTIPVVCSLTSENAKPCHQQSSGTGKSGQLDNFRNSRLTKCYHQGIETVKETSTCARPMSSLHCQLSPDFSTSSTSTVLSPSAASCEIRSNTHAACSTPQETCYLFSTPQRQNVLHQDHLDDFMLSRSNFDLPPPYSFVEDRV